MSATLDSYQQRRAALEAYFDRTAAETWRRLTSDAPVSRIRATVRAGRDEMRATMLSWLPANMRGLRLLDAGCGTGAFAVEAARRGAEVVAIDLSPTLIDTARERLPAGLAGRVDFRAGDMREAGEGMFDIAVAMDSLIHYRPADAVRALGDIAARTRGQMVITFAPRTPMLSAMHAVGQLFPRGDRSPAIVPVGVRTLRRGIDAALGQDGWASARSHRVDRGFYISQALEVVRR